MAGIREIVGVLLLACCAAGFAPRAGATTLDEFSNDYGDTFATRTTAPNGTDFVTGTVNIIAGVEDIDYLAFTDLVPNAAFRFSMVVGGASTDFGDPVRAQFFDASGAALSSILTATPFTAAVFDGTVPTSGELVLWLRLSALPEDNHGMFYVSLTGPRVVVPEPSTALLLGVGLIALAQRRNRSH